ncbi:MAG: hypothetical protein WAX77_11230 [Methylococcaceae bacterium]
MKRNLLALLLIAISNFVYAIPQISPEKYELSIGGSPSWGTGTTNFWEHNYWYPKACPNGATHTGRDTHTESKSNKRLNKIRSYGFGQVSIVVLGEACIKTDATNNIAGSVGALSSISIKHLLDSGETIQTNLLHGEFLATLSNNSYLAKSQYLGTEDNRGLGSVNKKGIVSCGAVHLHTEISSTTSLAWICTANAVPSADGQTQLDTKYSKDELIGHYDKNRLSRIYYSPDDTFNKHSELLPWLSNNNSNITPSSVNFDVYGIINQPLYGQMLLSRENAKDFKAIGILMKNGRRGALVDIQTPNGKWLATTWENPIVNDFNSVAVTPVNVSGVSYPVKGHYTYTTAGDYVAIPFVTKDGTELLKGYPVKFSIVNQGDIVVDNDQRNADADSTNDLKTEPAYNGKTGLKVPGYFLTADLHSGRSKASAQWKPYKNGNYKIYVHVPEYGATAIAVKYVIKKDGTNPTAVNSKPIDQSVNADRWVQLIALDNSDTFQFDDNGYVGLSLGDALDAANYPVDATQTVAFDAVKFELTNSSSIIPYKATYSIIQAGNCSIGGGTEATGQVDINLTKNNNGFNFTVGSHIFSANYTSSDSANVDINATFQCNGIKESHSSTSLANISNNTINVNEFTITWCEQMGCIFKESWLLEPTNNNLKIKQLKNNNNYQNCQDLDCFLQ